MADNTTLPGTGNGTADIIVATDKIGGVDFQRVKLSLGADGTASDAPVGAGTEAGVLRVTLPTDGTGKVSAAQSGTWTVQPGNTANTTAWKVDGSAVTQPVSLASVPSHAVTNAGTFATQADTELPAAAALADGAANPTTPSVGADLQVYNGTTWDRLRGTVASAHVGNHAVLLTATPTLDTSAYASGDCLHTTVITFANAVAVSGGSATIIKMTVIDSDLQSAAGELWLFNATVTPAAANAAHSISDAHALLCVGVIPFGPYYASALNSVSVNASVSLPFTVAATSLFGILVTRGTPTYTVSGLTVNLFVAQD